MSVISEYTWLVEQLVSKLNIHAYSRIRLMKKIEFNKVLIGKIIRIYLSLLKITSITQAQFFHENYLHLLEEFFVKYQFRSRFSLIGICVCVWFEIQTIPKTTV